MSEFLTGTILLIAVAAVAVSSLAIGVAVVSGKNRTP